MEKKKALKWLAVFIGTGLTAVTLLVIIFDPFYQYHDPLPGTEAVLYDRDNQVPGTVRNFSYDTVLLGSSVAENFDSAYIDRRYHARTIKIIRSNGSVADLLSFLQTARQKQEIRQVFWCMDIFALQASPVSTLTAEELPNYYLHTASIMDDAPYLFNKEILLEKIPLMLYNSSHGINTGGHAYDWSADQEFSVKRAMSAYRKPAFPDREERLEYVTALQEGNIPQMTYQEVPDLEENMEMVLQEINSHPEITYTVFFPPYSMLWWDCGYVNGESEKYVAVLEYAMPKLVSCENVELYNFQNEKDIVCNLNYYMDMIHYSPEINQYMLECIDEGENRVTEENVENSLLSVKELYYTMITEKIFNYYK